MTQSAKQILATNLNRLMAEHPRYNRQQSLANACGLSQSTIANLLQVDFPSWPRLDIIEAVASAFGLTASELLAPDLQCARAAMFGRTMTETYAALADAPEALADFLAAATALSNLAKRTPG